ncbi:MAG: ABC transporter permease [Tetragenococcus sp.]|nr:ABC transporter permease [Tetragenococcus sp.]
MSKLGKLINCLFVEQKKFFKSNLPLLTILAFTLVPFMAGFFMFVLKDPESAENLGFISTKAQILGDTTVSWSAYLELLTQAISVGGLFVFGFIMAWIFGREYSDKTLNNLLALPISRNIIVFAKFVVAFLWCCLLGVFVFTLGIIVGSFIQIPGWSTEVLLQGATTFIICSLLTVVLSIPVAFFACIGKSYLTPIGFIVFTVVFSQIITAIGYGEIFPWSIPALASGISGNPVLKHYSILVVIVVGILGWFMTSIWWKYADQP